MMCVKAITVRFHLSHSADKQAWDKLSALRVERHQSFSQTVVDAINAYESAGVHLSCTDKNELVQEITESVAGRLQQMLPAFLAGYSAGASAPAAVSITPTSAPQLLTAVSSAIPAPDDDTPDFGDSCMDFDFIGG